MASEYEMLIKDNIPIMPKLKDESIVIGKDEAVANLQ
jgi:hypothetical protein